jgi:hypothetical protein
MRLGQDEREQDERKQPRALAWPPNGTQHQMDGFRAEA